MTTFEITNRLGTVVWTCGERKLAYRRAEVLCATLGELFVQRVVRTETRTTVKTFSPPDAERLAQGEERAA